MLGFNNEVYRCPFVVDAGHDRLGVPDRDRRRGPLGPGRAAPARPPRPGRRAEAREYAMLRLLANRRGLARRLLSSAACWPSALWPTPVPVDVAHGRAAGRCVVTVDEEGETRVRDRFVVSAPVAGPRAAHRARAGRRRRARARWWRACAPKRRRCSTPARAPRPRRPSRRASAALGRAARRGAARAARAGARRARAARARASWPSGGLGDARRSSTPREADVRAADGRGRRRGVRRRGRRVRAAARAEARLAPLAADAGGRAVTRHARRSTASC